MGYSGNSLNSAQEITFGAAANETPLTEENEDELRELVARLFARRIAGGDKRDPLYRMQPERWLESSLRRNIEPLDAHLDPAHVYTQVPAFAASDRVMLDLLGVLNDSRLAVIELKAEEDLHLALQGLDYWVDPGSAGRALAKPTESGLTETERGIKSFSNLLRVVQGRHP
jgi:hypothetical protein